MILWNCLKSTMNKNEQCFASFSSTLQSWKSYSQIIMQKDGFLLTGCQNVCHILASKAC